MSTAAMDDAMHNSDFSELPKWFQDNETLVLPSLQNTLNEMRDKLLHSLWINTQPSNLMQVRDEAIGSAIQRYGLRVFPGQFEESPRPAKKQKTGDESEDDFVASAIESAIAEKGLR